ncbi:KaiC domain-containing protein [Halorientalis sp. IM1011]|uniref:KaiC domain-containing protein n=1 Tax=Halorientalis sp. IM1011 TaxID=1932360 RepID=UPI00097CCF7A|nr:KaiC domain-containing protein [Halorientalis sp. IM1011]AQL43446.1 KaiC domain-containing protein [Halorientalis sp. IM1011]
MSEDDDWFESAVGDGDDDTDSDDTDFTDDGSDDADGEGSPFDADESARSDDGGDGSPFDGGSDSPFEGGDDSGGFGDGSADEGATPFGGDDAAFAETDGASDETPFGGGSDDDSPFGGGGEAGGDGELFDDDFASAFGSAGGGGGGGSSEFDDEDFESDLPRLDLGIEGLDNMIQGGIPRRHLIVTIGSAGTGKTTFGLQFLHHGLEKEDTEKAVFITLEQSHDAIMATADEHDWNFERHEEEDDLAIIDLDPVEMANSLQNIQAELPELIEDFGADRLVLDSVSLLEMMYNDQAKRRTQVFDFTRSLKKAGVTTMLTSEASESHEYASRHGIIEYLTDAVVHLRYVRQETRETRMAVEIQKIRNANHSRETKPYEITDEGISVYQQANIF